ncbi:MAG: hypothetical protein ACLRMX_04655 [Lachnospira eligens]
MTMIQRGISASDGIFQIIVIGNKNIFAYYAVGQDYIIQILMNRQRNWFIKADKIYDRCNLYIINNVYMDNILYQIRTNSRADFDKRLWC